MYCHRCHEVVTHPVCPDCLADAVSEGLQVDVGDWIRVDASGTPCILCGQDIALCSYCATEDLLAEVEVKHPELKDSFLEFFHMDLDKQGYAKSFFEFN